MTEQAPEIEQVPPLLAHAKIHEAARRAEAEARVCSQIDMTYTLTFGDFVEQRVGCPGDGRYMPPGRGHLTGCQHDAVKWVWEDVRPVAPHTCHHDGPAPSNRPEAVSDRG